MCKKYVHIHVPPVVFLNFLALLQSRISRENTSNMLMNIILNNYTGDNKNSKEKLSSVSEIDFPVRLNSPSMTRIEYSIIQCIFRSVHNKFWFYNIAQVTENTYHIRRWLWFGLKHGRLRWRWYYRLLGRGWWGSWRCLKLKKCKQKQDSLTCLMNKKHNPQPLHVHTFQKIRNQKWISNEENLQILSGLQHRYTYM